MTRKGCKGTGRVVEGSMRKDRINKMKEALGGNAGGRRITSHQKKKQDKKFTRIKTG